MRQHHAGQEPQSVPPVKRKRGHPFTGRNYTHRKTFELADRHIELLEQVRARRGGSQADALRSILDAAIAAIADL